MTYRESLPSAEEIERRRIEERFDNVERDLRRVAVAGVVAATAFSVYVTFVSTRVPTTGSTPIAPAETEEQHRITLDQDHALCTRTCGAYSSECTWLSGGRRRCSCSCPGWAWASSSGDSVVVPTATVTEDR